MQRFSSGLLRSVPRQLAQRPAQRSPLKVVVASSAYQRFFSSTLSPSEETLKASTPLSSFSGTKSPDCYLLQYTCKVCNLRDAPKKISKHAYHKGLVLVQCSKCKNRHLIADNFGWFADAGQGGPSEALQTTNIEKIMREKGEKVTVVRFTEEEGEGLKEAATFDDLVEEGLIQVEEIDRQDADAEKLL